VENSVCLLRNLSYHVHREIPGCERFAEATPLNQGPAPGSQKGGCFGSKKGKGQCRAFKMLPCQIMDNNSVFICVGVCCFSRGERFLLCLGLLLAGEHLFPCLFCLTLLFLSILLPFSWPPFISLSLSPSSPPPCVLNVGYV